MQKHAMGKSCAGECHKTIDDLSYTCPECGSHGSKASTGGFGKAARTLAATHSNLTQQRDNGTGDQ